MFFRTVINIKDGSPAEEYFINKCCPKLKDLYGVRLGAIWGFPGVNQYDISWADRWRIRKEIKVLKTM